MFSVSHFFLDHVRTGLSALRQLSYVFISGLLLCLSIGSVQAQTVNLPEGYAFEPLAGGIVHAPRMVVHAVGDDIYFGGEAMETFDEFPIQRIARWDGSQLHMMGQGLRGSGVYAIASAKDGSIYVGGSFNRARQSDGTELHIFKLARFKNGEWSVVGNTIEGQMELGVNALEVVEHPDGTHDLYVGGSFSSILDDDHDSISGFNGLARWDGSRWHRVGKGVYGRVASISYSKARGGLYVGGAFTYAHPTDHLTTATPSNGALFWDFATEQWQAIGVVDGALSNVTKFQETADGESVFIAYESGGLRRFDWSSDTLTTLTTETVSSIQLMPDQRRLISTSGRNLTFWDLSQADLAPQHFSFPVDNFESIVMNRHGVYLGYTKVESGFSSLYAARLVVPDMDGDSVANDIDNCPLKPNADQLDSNKDGVGDACEPEQISALSCPLKTFTVTHADTLSLSPDGRALYVGSATGNQLTRIDTRLHTQTHTDVGLGPWAVLASRDGMRVYAANKYSHTISVLNATTLEELHTISSSATVTLSGPTALAESADGNYLFIANFDNNSVAVLDTQTNNLIRTIAVGAGPYYLLAAGSGDDEKLYVVNGWESSLSVLSIADSDPANWQSSQTIAVGSGPNAMSLDQHGYLYVSNEDSKTISVIDTASNTVISTINLTVSPVRSQLSADGRQLYVAEWDGTGVTVIDTELARTNPAQAVLHRWEDIGSENVDVKTLIGERRAYISSRDSNTVTMLAINQVDRNGNGVGDDCDDLDNDNVIDGLDNCPGSHNPNQTDSDQDGAGDDCDAFDNDPTEWLDTDNDSVGNNADICPNDPDYNCLANPAVDSDGDGVPNGADLFPLDPTKWRDGDMAEAFGTAAKQNFGQVIVNLGDINNDYADDYAIGTPNFKASTQVNGKTKLLNKAGKVDVISGKTGEVLLSRTGSAAKALFGSAVVAADIDRDGLIDIAIGSPGANKNNGEVMICLATVDGSFNCDQTITPEPILKASLFGSSLAVAEIDNSAQLFIGAVNAKNDSGKKVGAFIRIENDVFDKQELRYGTAVNGGFGSAIQWLPENELLAVGAPKANKTGEVALWDVLNDQLDSTLTGQTKGEQFGKVLAVGSLAFDSPENNTEHLIVSAPLAASDKLKQAGRVDVYDLAASDEPMQRYFGATKSEQLGTSLAVDDQQNLFVGSAAYTVPKTANSKAIKKAGKVSRFTLAANDAHAELTGSQANQQFGASLAAIELTGDFTVDLLVGSIGANDLADKKLKAAGKLELINANDWQ